VTALTKEKAVALEREPESRQNVFRKEPKHGSSALQPSYRVGHLLAKETGHFFPMGSW
jgi:hypothetical protein